MSGISPHISAAVLLLRFDSESVEKYYGNRRITAPDHDLGVFRSGEKQTFRMTFDTKYLTRGKYKVYAILFEKNDFGTCQDHDLVIPAFFFEIQDDEDITWNVNQWGHVRFPEMNFYRQK